MRTSYFVPIGACYLTDVRFFLSTFASSAPSGIVGQLIEEFSLSTEVAVLTISLFVAGYCVGPLVWGPLSEQLGRKPVFVVSFFVYTLFQVACALAPNTGALLAFRFIGGTFAAAPLANSGYVVSLRHAGCSEYSTCFFHSAVIADIWDAETRGKALAIFTLAPFAGPSLGPTVSGFITVAGASWKWMFWVQTIFAGVCLIGIIFTLPETYV